MKRWVFDQRRVRRALVVASFCLAVALSAAEDLLRSGFVGVKVTEVPDDVRASSTMPSTSTAVSGGRS